MRLLDSPDIELKGVDLHLEGRRLIPDVRRFHELVDVLRNPEEIPDLEGVAYYMYRDLPPLRGSWARFDVTVIPYWSIGDEHAKTKGHYHLPSPSGLPYPELYQVHSGRAIYLLQRPGKRVDEVEDFVVIAAGPGDAVVIPPWYGHVTVNPGPEILVMSNLIFRGVRSNYEPFERLRGACYHYTTEGLIPNDAYSSLPEPRSADPIRVSDPLVLRFSKEPSKFDWLRRPEVVGEDDWWRLDF